MAEGSAQVGAGRTDGRWTVVPVGPDDFPVLARLFAESFGHPISEALWRWKYGEGRGRGLFAVGPDGPVAHYGALSRPARFYGSPILALQPVDVLVRPRERGVLTRKGPMFLAATTLFEAEMGLGRRHLLGFGFPTARHLLLAERLGLFVPGGRVIELEWPVGGISPPQAVRWSDLHEGSGQRFDRVVDLAWRQMARDLWGAIVGVRDAAWLRYRYLAHPERRYRIIAVRGRPGSRLCGVVVLRTEGARCEVLDLVGPLRATPRLIEAALAVAREEGAESLYGWFAEPFAWCLPREGAHVNRTDVQNVVFTWTRTPPIARTRDHWWLTAGDTDFR